MAGCSLGVTLAFANFENVKPNFFASETETTEVPDSMTPEDKEEWMRQAMARCRKVCEEKVDEDIYDIKHRRVFKEIRKEKQEDK